MCDPPAYIYVPSAVTGWLYEVAWPASATAGVTYVLEEATDIFFTSPSVVYSGTATRATLVSKASGNYYYRVKATKALFTDSPFVTVGANTVNLSSVCAPPAYIYVPAANTGGTYDVAWPASATAGVTYVVEEAGNDLFTTPKVVYTGTATRTTLTGQLPGTYYYRVIATEPGFADSPFVTAGMNVITVN